MSYNKKLKFDTVRTLAFAAVGAAYANVGTALTKEPRILSLTNGTNVGVWFTATGNDEVYLPALGIKVYDMSTVRPAAVEPPSFPVGTQFQVKHDGTVATSGRVTVEIIDEV